MIINEHCSSWSLLSTFLIFLKTCGFEKCLLAGDATLNKGQCFQKHSIHGKTIYQYLRHWGQISDGKKPAGMDKAATKTWTRTGLFPLSVCEVQRLTHTKSKFCKLSSYYQLFNANLSHKEVTENCSFGQMYAGSGKVLAGISYNSGLKNSPSQRTKRISDQL